MDKIGKIAGYHAGHNVASRFDQKVIDPRIAQIAQDRWQIQPIMFTTVTEVIRRTAQMTHTFNMTDLQNL